MKLKVFIIVIGVFTILDGCEPNSYLDAEVKSSLSKELREVMPGILEGYLSTNELPNSVDLLSPPPYEGSMAFKVDQEIASK